MYCAQMSRLLFRGYETPIAAESGRAFVSDWGRVMAVLINFSWPYGYVNDNSTAFQKLLPEIHLRCSSFTARGSHANFWSNVNPFVLLIILNFILQRRILKSVEAEYLAPFRL